MFRYLCFAFLLFTLSLTVICARDLSIDYLDGYLEVESGGNWDTLDIGDIVSDGDTIRLTDDSYAELLMDNVKITLDKDGIYEVATLLDQLQKVDKWGIKGSSFAKLFRDNEIDSRQSAVMGVRGDPQDEETITWVDDDIEFLEEGKTLYFKGDFSGAIQILEEGAEWYGSNYEEILFYKVLCEYESGQIKKMRDTLFKMDPYPESEYYGDYVLLKGNVLIESQNYIEAEELFDSYLSDSEKKDEEQIVYLLSAFCSLELEEMDFARRKLEKAISIDPHSETGRKAREILSNL